MQYDKHVVVLVGGVGGAKLALGLQAVVPPQKLTVIVNTGDDFWHYGLRICPDIDTILYTLSGRVDPSNGWGVAGDSTVMLDSLRELGEAAWFRLGDKDLATHLLRTHRLQQGQSLTNIVQHLAQMMGVQPSVLPMTDEPMPTMVQTGQGELEFQEYFVRERWQPVVNRLRYAHSEQATVPDPVRDAITTADVIVIGPSNPWLSIGPILAVPGLRDLLLMRHVPCVAVTPIVQGAALKGPAAKLMRELGYAVTAQTVAEYYGPVINGFVYDERDEELHMSGLRLLASDTIMKTTGDKARLAKEILDWVGGWDRL